MAMQVPHPEQFLSITMLVRARLVRARKRLVATEGIQLFLPVLSPLGSLSSLSSIFQL